MWGTASREGTVAPLARELELDQAEFVFVPFRLEKAHGLLLVSLSLSKELCEDRDLGADHLRHERLDQVVDRSDPVALVDEVHVRRLTGQEQDRNRGGPLTLLDGRCQLEAAHLGHHDINEKNREVLFEESKERFGARVRFDDSVIPRRQDRPKSRPVLRRDRRQRESARGSLPALSRARNSRSSSHQLARRFRTMTAASCRVSAGLTT